MQNTWLETLEDLKGVNGGRITIGCDRDQGVVCIYIGEDIDIGRIDLNYEQAHVVLRALRSAIYELWRINPGPA